MFTLTTSARYHSRTHSQVRSEICLENLKKRKSVVVLGALDFSVVPLAAGPRAPEKEPWDEQEPESQ
jgi:hypothetical protein